MPCANNCKVGRCSKCDSNCRRCGCACDGQSPEEALSRKRGQRGKSKYTSLARTSRLASTAAKKKIQSQAKLISDTPKRDKRIREDRLSQLWEFQGWERSTKGNVPSEKDRWSNPDLKSASPKGWSSMVQSLLLTIQDVAGILFPANPDRLIDDAVNKLQQAPKDYDKLESVLLNAYNGAPIRSVEKRVLRAVAVKGISTNRQRQLVEQKVISRSGSMVQRAREDYQSLCDGFKLTQTKRNLQNFKPEQVEGLVKFILHASNVGTLSWGEKVVVLDDKEKVTLPRLIRRKPRKMMYDDYSQQFDEEPSAQAYPSRLQSHVDGTGSLEQTHAGNTGGQSTRGRGRGRVRGILSRGNRGRGTGR